ncbi:MAG: DMT family transporter [Gaiellales bacterium]
MPGRSRLWTVGAPALFVVLWSTGFITSKEAVKYAEPMTLLVIRYAAAAVLCLAIALLLRARWPARRTLGHMVVVGLLLHGCYIGGVFAAIDHGLPASVAALVVGLQPILTAVVVGPLLGERFRPAQWLGLALGLAGVALVLLRNLETEGWAVGAILLAVLALVGITAGTLYQKRFCANEDVRSASVIQYAATCLALLPLAFAFDSGEIDWAPALVASLAWMVVVLSVGAVSLLYLLIRYGEAGRTASLFYLVPPVTAVLAWLWFGESLGWVGVVGIAVTAVGVSLVQRGGQSAAAVPPE